MEMKRIPDFLNKYKTYFPDFEKVKTITNIAELDAIVHDIFDNIIFFNASDILKARKERNELFQEMLSFCKEHEKEKIDLFYYATECQRDQFMAYYERGFKKVKIRCQSNCTMYKELDNKIVETGMLIDLPIPRKDENCIYDICTCFWEPLS